MAINKAQWGLVDDEGRIVRSPTRCAVTNETIGAGGIKRRIGDTPVFYALSSKAHDKLKSNARERALLEQSLIAAWKVDNATGGAASPEPNDDPDGENPPAENDPEDDESGEATEGDALGSETLVVDDPDLPEAPGLSVNFDMMTKAEIVDWAAEQGIDVPVSYTKAEMIQHINENML